MKVRVTFTIDVDPRAWDDVYGTTHNPARVRKDVKDYVPLLVHELLTDQGVLNVDKEPQS